MTTPIYDFVTNYIASGTSRLHMPGHKGHGPLCVENRDITEIEGADVLCEMPISFCQAACGADIEVPTLDGKVRYNVPEGTQTGTTFRLKGKGIPYVGYKNRGDQYVTVVVETPTKLSREQKDILRQFEDATEKAQPKRKSFFDKLKRNFG
jgi:molecular chaperone DnaJ